MGGEQVMDVYHAIELMSDENKIDLLKNILDLKLISEEDLEELMC